MEYEEAYRRLNSAQKEAVDQVEGPVLVIAGPGTGKTQLLSTRVASILKKTDADPSNILCLTFTDVAAQNMRERLQERIGTQAHRVNVSTFHSFGEDIFKQYPEYFTETPLLELIDELGTYELLQSILEKLPHQNLLRRRANDVFLHLNSIKTTISWCARAGLTPSDLTKLAADNEVFIKFIESHLQAPFETSPSMAQLSKYKTLAATLEKFVVAHPTNGLALQAAEELKEAIEELPPDGRYAKPITAWRTQWLVRDQPGHWVCVDKRNTVVLKAFTEVYASFQNELRKRGLYNFDDMILRTLEALKTQPELLLRLQEQYQYILVDEYQDTNGAQNMLLDLLADNIVNEGKPNLMVVGDDDQAIYRFQGAESSVMLDFLQRWRDVKQVALQDNYRSGQTLLSASREIITMGEDRLEQHVPGLSKELQVASDPPPESSVASIQAGNEIEQYYYVADEINKLVANGTKPSSIAVLAPKHKYLLALVPYLQANELPIAYERREHILEQPHIIELVQLSRVIEAIRNKDWPLVDSMLPDVLAVDYWQLETRALWHLSLRAHREKRFWLELMAEQDTQLKTIAEVLLSLGREAIQQPFDTMFDYMIGNQPITLDNKETWTLPYRRHYFNDTKLHQQASDYMKLLGQLRSLRNRVHNYSRRARVMLGDFIRFVDLYEQSGLTLLDESASTNDAEAIQLMTAYKAKGLEWDSVFILGCHEDIWGSRTRSGSNSFSLPTNLHWIKPATDTLDDRLRLFYVAITRARRQLVLTSFANKDNGRATEPLAWLSAAKETIPSPTELPALPDASAIVSQELALSWDIRPLKQNTLQSELQNGLKRYRLSTTHLSSFLDVTKGGPRAFLYHHLLHFPQRQHPTAAYGSAVHEALRAAHSEMISTDKPPSIKHTVAAFTAELDRASLSADERTYLLNRGTAALNDYLKSPTAKFYATDKSEYPFAREGVAAGKAQLTGKVDLIREISSSEVAVIDYKTGAAFESWRPPTAYGQIRAHLYKQQLIFYKLLVEGSGSYKGKQKVTQSYLQFVEPNERDQFLQLDFEITKEDEERVVKLIERVWHHIMMLDFPDTSGYSLDLKGLLAFEEDLLNEK